jgi:hypothetical protein
MSYEQSGISSQRQRRVMHDTCTFKCSLFIAHISMSIAL